MMKVKLDDVFGVSSKPVFSYVEREEVDNRFIDALASEKQVIIYGSSKQGKTSLVSKHVVYDQNIVINLSPRTSLTDIYSSILRQLDIDINTGHSDSSEREGSVGLTSKFKAMIPLFGSGEIEGSSEIKSTSGKNHNYEEVPFNLSLPQDIAEILKKIKFNKFIILENFHYLNDDLQNQFAYDLRSFQEMGVRFIILGVWREKNKMAQFNGDLLDRIVEVPVEPWCDEDFLRVAQKGAKKLSIHFSEELLNRCREASFKSIGVFQEIIKEVCLSANITTKQKQVKTIHLEDLLTNAIAKKAEDYSVRHQRALEAIASGNPSSSSKNNVQPLFLPYYLVKVILQSGYEGMKNGMMRSVVQSKIQELHHRGNDVRASDMSNLLYNLAKLQSNKNISPPIIDYDRNTKSIQVVDSTFYFFLKNANLLEISEELPNPLED